MLLVKDVLFLSQINVQCLRTKEKGKTNGKGKTKDAMFTLCEGESKDQMSRDNQTAEELVMTATGCQVQSSLFPKINLFIIIVIIMQQNLLAMYQVEIHNLSYYY